MQTLRALCAVTSLALLSVACDGEEAPEEPRSGVVAGAPSDVQPLVVDPNLDPATDSDLQAMLRAPGLVRWRNLGNARFVPAADERGPDYEVRNGKAPARLMVGMVTERGHYLLEFDTTRMHKGDDAGNVAEPGFVRAAGNKGWSNGDDSRVERTGAAVPIAVGRITPLGGTGALIGRRIVRTAAHVIIEHTTTGGRVPALTGVTFNYRRDRNTGGIQTATSGFFYSANYLPSNCATSTPTEYSWGYRTNIDQCTWFDWAYLILPTNWYGSGNISWFGYRMLGTNDLNLELRSGGYPNCSNAGAPTGCVFGAYWEDTSGSCAVSGWLTGTAKWRTGCDTSPGHSGAPLWQEGTTWLVGHHVYEECIGNTCPGGSRPNLVLGHDQGLFDYQQSLRAMFP